MAHFYMAQDYTMMQVPEGPMVVPGHLLHLSLVRHHCCMRRADRGSSWRLRLCQSHSGESLALDVSLTVQATLCMALE